MNIKPIRPERAQGIIETREPRGLFLTKEGNKYVAIDNTDGNAWTEEFKKITVAMAWLRGEMDTGEAYEADNK